MGITTTKIYNTRIFVLKFILLSNLFEKPAIAFLRLKAKNHPFKGARGKRKTAAFTQTIAEKTISKLDQEVTKRVIILYHNEFLI